MQELLLARVARRSYQLDPLAAIAPQVPGSQLLIEREQMLMSNLRTAAI